MSTFPETAHNTSIFKHRRRGAYQPPQESTFVSEISVSIDLAPTLSSKTHLTNERTLEEVDSMISYTKSIKTRMSQPTPIQINLPNIPEPLSLIRIISSIRPGSGRRRSSLSLVATSVLPPDQPHVYKGEEHSCD